MGVYSIDVELPKEPEYKFPITAEQFKSHIRNTTSGYFKTQVQKMLDRTAALLERAMKENKSGAKPQSKVFVECLGEDTDSIVKAAASFLTAQGFSIEIEKGNRDNPGYLIISVS